MRLGFDEAILLDPQGYVGECTGENIFVVRDGKITTPDTSAILEGITRESILLPDVRDESLLAQTLRGAMGELMETTFHYVRSTPRRMMLERVVSRIGQKTSP